MPAAAMRMRRKPISTATRRMIIHRMITIMATITTTSIAITTIITAIPMLMTTSRPPVRPRRRAGADAKSQDPVLPTLDRSAMNASEAAALYRLMTWLSPAFPVGAFSYSSGIEWAVEAGDIGDAASLRDWLASMLADGTGFCDGVFLAHAHRAATSRARRGIAMASSR